jgi:hypothetical protein
MSKKFVIAIVRANGTRVNVMLSNRIDVETFVARDGALGWLEKTVALQTPVEALVYRKGSDDIEEAWFFEKGSKRKLDILTLVGETK